MSRRFKTRATAGRRFKSGTMANFTTLSDIVSTAYRGDGDAGTLNMSLYTLIAGIVGAADVRYGVARYTGGSTGTLVGIVDGTGTIYATGIYDGSTRYATTGLSVGDVISGTNWQDGDGLHSGTATEESHTANEVLKSAGGNYNDDNLSVGNVRPVAFGLSQTGTLANLAADDAAYVTLEQSRNTDPGESNVLDGVTYLIRGASYEGSALAGIPESDIVGAEWVVVGHSNYVGGSAGTYPTTATSQAEQLATDQAAVTSAKAGVTTTTTILGVTGTLDMSLYALLSGITWPALTSVDGGVHFGPTTGTEYEGTGMTPAEVAAAMAAAGLTLPGGSFAQTVTVTRADTAAVIPNAWVSIYSGSTEVDRKQTNESGVATPRCNAGTYSIVAWCDGYSSTTVTGISVSSAANRSVTLTAATVSASTLGKTTLYGTCYDEDTVAEKNVVVTCKMTDPGTAAGCIFSGAVATATTDSNGQFEFINRVQGATYKIARGAESKSVLVGTNATQAVGSFIGVDA